MTSFELLLPEPEFKDITPLVERFKIFHELGEIFVADFKRVYYKL